MTKHITIRITDGNNILYKLLLPNHKQFCIEICCSILLSVKGTLLSKLTL